MQETKIFAWLRHDQTAGDKSRESCLPFRRQRALLARGVQMVVDEQIVFNGWRPAKPIEVFARAGNGNGSDSSAAAL